MQVRSPFKTSDRWGGCKHPPHYISSIPYSRKPDILLRSGNRTGNEDRKFLSVK